MLYNNAKKPKGTKGFDTLPITIEIAERFLETATSFDILNGRKLYLDLSDDRGFNTSSYNHHNGRDAAEQEIMRIHRLNAMSRRVDNGMSPLLAGFLGYQIGKRH